MVSKRSLRLSTAQERNRQVAEVELSRFTSMHEHIDILCCATKSSSTHRVSARGSSKDVSSICSPPWSRLVREIMLVDRSRSSAGALE